MHRRIEAEGEVDVPYRTLVKNLKNLGIHDPTESPGRSQAWEQRDDEDSAEDDDQEETDAGDEPNRETTQEATSESEPEATTETGQEPHPEPDQEDVDAGDEQADPVATVIDVDDPADATSFQDLATPDWLTEASFHTAIEMSEDAAEFSENLGWGDPDDLQLMVEVLGLEDEFGGNSDV
jgi:hypothetical protein